MNENYNQFDDFSQFYKYEVDELWHGNSVKYKVNVTVKLSILLVPQSFILRSI